MMMFSVFCCCGFSRTPVRLSLATSPRGGRVIFKYFFFFLWSFRPAAIVAM
jgi:hypothetical protein